MAQYGTEAGFEAYCEARGYTMPAGDALAALVRASTWLDATYRSRFPGRRVAGRTQELEWPRTGATDVSGEEVADDENPVEIEQATYEAARRELTTPGSLAPDFTPLDGVKRVRKKVGDLEKETEYRDAPSSAANAMPVFAVIDGILSGLLGRPSGGSVDLLRV